MKGISTHHHSMATHTDQRTVFFAYAIHVPPPCPSNDVELLPPIVVQLTDGRD